ncbi:hypothetical protein LSH36_190g00069 [Paralvinella palmiformis]|uniref:Uncharacterized protein n=1 Tax=Paralvinella palmiformis TaxID=53620 RepID=A0AAD9N562_9ANNE|nr:hypothetical protein LSH36_190g00069 [Paralvinella palmiformis]
MCVGLQYWVQQYNMMFSVGVWLIIGNLCGMITGNVGLYKSANMTVEGLYKASYPATGALDGVSPGSQDRLQQFDLTVYNTSDNEILCGYHHDIINTYSTITCTRPVIGRYVHFKRKGGPEITETALCEVVIIGHKYIDCSHCPVGVTCNDVTGCTQCHGSYPPDCKQSNIYYLMIIISPKICLYDDILNILY